MRRATQLATIVALFLGCVGYEPGIEVALVVLPSDEGALRDVTLGDGSTMHLDALTLTLDSAELIPCGSAGGHHHTAGFDDILRDLVAPARAFAQHHHSSPLLLLGPITIDFASPATDVPGVFGAAPGCYDRVALTLRDLSIGAHQGDTSSSAASTTTVTARATIEPPLMLEGRGDHTVVVHLARSSSFALLTTMSDAADGDRVLAGIAAQSRARLLD